MIAALDEVIAKVDALREALHALREDMPDMVAVGDVGEAERPLNHLSRWLHGKAETVTVDATGQAQIDNEDGSS